MRLPVLAVAITWPDGLLVAGLAEVALAFMAYRFVREPPIRSDPPSGGTLIKNVVDIRRGFSYLPPMPVCTNQRD